MSGPRDPDRLTQLDLFRVSPATPDWERLPPEVRRKAVTLLARMLSPRRPPPVAVDPDREVDDE